MSLIFYCTALQLLRKLGWVHRDVSVGNILSYKGEAKLADLEYAKRVGDGKSHEMRTASRSSMNLSGV
jgi:serine/threonine protein kinase